MELGKLDESKEALIDVAVAYDKDGEPLSGFKIVGANSDRYRDAIHSWRLSNIKRSARKGAPADLSKQEGAEEWAGALVRREEVIARAVVVDIYGFTENKAPVPFSAEVLDRLFKARPTWIGKIVAVAEAEQSFTPATLAA